MKRVSILLFVFSLPALAQSPPAIRSIIPAVGPGSGGISVTISGDHLGLPPGFACILPCPARVTFGGAPANLQLESDVALIVKTPPHAAGGVDVTVTTGDGRTVTAPNAFLYTDDLEAAYERVLLPIYLETNVGGNHGSLWQTQLWLRNNGASGVTLAPWVCPFGALCPAVFPLTRTLQPGETLLNLPAINQANAGRLLGVAQTLLSVLTAQTGVSAPQISPQNCACMSSRTRTPTPEPRSRSSVKTIC